MKSAGLGKILGTLGLLSLLSAPYTYFLTSGSALLSGAKVLVGLVFISVFFATNVGRLGEVASRRSSFFVASSVLYGVLCLALVTGINVIAAKKNRTFDLTRKQIFSLAPQTVAALRGLPETVHVTAFLGAGKPGYEDAEALLARFHQEAPKKLTVSFKDPLKAPDLATKYQVHEGPSTFILARSEGAKETHTAITLVADQQLTEQDVTNALLKLSSVGEQKVYFLVGHGEWPLDSTGGSDEEQGLGHLVGSLLQEGYAPQALNLVSSKEGVVPRDASLVVIAGARTPVSAREEQTLRTYLDEGGRMLVFTEPATDMGLKATLAAYGVELDKGVIADTQASVDNPYVILTNFFSEHEMVRSLKKLQLIIQLPMARGLTLLHGGLLPGVKVEPVLTTSPYAWEVTKLSQTPEKTDGDKAGSIPLVSASTRSTVEAKHKRYDEARLVVVGNSQLLADANWGHEPNRNLVLNALGWASNQVEKVTLRPTDRDISTLDLDDATLRRLRFVSTDLLPLSLLGLGLTVWMRRRNL